MKIFTVLGSLFFLSHLTQAQIITIPDANFKDTLVNMNCVDTNGDGTFDSDADSNNDGEIDQNEALAVTALDINKLNLSEVLKIESIEGLEFFSNLTYLNARANKISQYNFANNPLLKTLTLIQNEFSSIDVSVLPSLENFRISSNFLTEIDVTSNVFLETLDVGDNNLSEIDTRSNPELIVLFIGGNSNILDIDISQNLKLVAFLASGSSLTTVDLSMHPSLQFFGMSDSLLETIDLSNNPELDDILIFNNPNLTEVNIQNGQNFFIKAMFTFNCPKLFCIQVDDPVFSNNESCGLPVAPIGWCKDDQTDYSKNCNLSTTLETNDNSTIIHPIPFTNEIFIESTETISEVRIYDTAGKLHLVTKNVSNISLEHLLSGVYFVATLFDKKTTYTRVIKD